MELQPNESFSPSVEAIHHQLDRMLTSPDFNASPQQTELLRYVVNQTLAGNSDEIKGYTVATEVFGRGPDFDQSIDPVVSIQAGRLRRAIEYYYLTAGKNDVTRIDIPKGGYVPIFSERVPEPQPVDTRPAVSVDFASTWPTILVQPLSNLTANPNDEFLSTGLAAELAHALSHYREIRVLEPLHRDLNSLSPEKDTDFILDGNIRRDSEGIKVAMRLYDARSGLQIWAGKYQGDFDAVKMISFQEDLAAEVAVLMTGGNAVIARHLSGQSRQKAITELTTYEAILRYWEYDTQRTRQSYERALFALKHAVELEPDCGQIWSMLACLYADNYGLEMVDLPTSLEKAAECARIGIRFDPTDRRARAISAYVRFMENQLPESRREAEKAYRLHSHSIKYLDVIGWLMSLAGEWDRGIDCIEKAMQINPYYRPWTRHALCLNWFRKGEYEKAYLETLHFGMSECHWDSLLKASACGHLEKMEEGKACVRELLALKPDFRQRGRILIGRYIKCEKMVAQVLEGLANLGMSID